MESGRTEDEGRREGGRKLGEIDAAMPRFRSSLALDGDGAGVRGAFKKLAGSRIALLHFSHARPADRPRFQAAPDERLTGSL